MNSLLLAAIAALAAAAPQTSLNSEQQRQIGCVATLAIVASEQERGRAGEWPPMKQRGARFAQVVGETVMKDSGWTKEQVRDAILAAVAERQKTAKAGGAAQDLPHAAVAECTALMDALTPAPPAPGLPQCAAMLALAHDDAAARQAGEARDLKTLAAVLDYRAREALRGEGRSGNEVDREMAEAREAIAAEAQRRAADPVAPGLDYGPCLEMARP